MKKMLVFLSAVAVILASPLFIPQAEAADDITHFYGSTFFAMASGIDRDFAVSMAVGNEMIDRGTWTNPMGLPTPRLLFHFLGTPLQFTVNEGGLKRGLAIATIKHPLFYNLLDTGLKSKDPVKLGAALHLLIDTFFHAGYSNLLGHGEAGHRPDMPYEEVQKARQCFQAIIEMMYIIRDMRPGTPDLSVMERIISEVTKNEIYGKKLKEITGARDLKEMTAVISRRPDLFTQVLLDNELVRNTFFTNVEKSNQYSKIAMHEILDIYKKQGYSKISDADVNELALQFKDITARTDIDPMQTLKIIIFRILQIQDPVLTRLANEDLIKHGFNPAELKDILERTHFDFSKIIGFSNMDALKSNIENDVKKNQDALKILIANVELFVSQIRTTNAAGETVTLRSHEWSQNTQTLAEHVFPEVLSWTRLFNQDGRIRLVEHRDVGNLISTQTDIDWMRNLMDHDPKFLENTLRLFKHLDGNPQVLKLAARLRVLAETSYHVANNSTKDMFPGKLSPIKKVVYEDDSLRHACFAKDCRVKAVQNLVAEYTNVNLVRGPDGFHTYVIRQIKTGLAKIGINKTVEKTNEQAAQLDQLVREFAFEIGFGSKDSSGKITLPMDNRDLVEVAPNLSLAGYLAWTKSTFNYVYRVMLKIGKAKNAAISKYIENGERVKSAVDDVLSKAYYTESRGVLPSAWLAQYGKLDLDKSKYQVTGLQKPKKAAIKCEKYFTN